MLNIKVIAKKSILKLEYYHSYAIARNSATQTGLS